MPAQVAGVMAALVPPSAHHGLRSKPWVTDDYMNRFTQTTHVKMLAMWARGAPGGASKSQDSDHGVVSHYPEV